MNNQLKVISPDYNKVWQSIKEMYIGKIKSFVDEEARNALTSKRYFNLASLGISVIALAIACYCIRSNKVSIGVTIICALLLGSLIYVVSRSEGNLIKSECEFVTKTISKLEELQLKVPEDFEKLESISESLFYSRKFFSGKDSFYRGWFLMREFFESINKILAFHDIEQHNILSYNNDKYTIWLDLEDNQGNVKIKKEYKCKVCYSTNVETDTLSFEKGSFLLTKKYTVNKSIE